MKNIRLLMLLFIPFLCRCTTAGDEIGDLYGRWKLECFSCPNTIEYPDSIFIGFQGKAYSYQPNWTYNWGMYSKDDATLFLNKLQYGGDFCALHIYEESVLFNIRKLNNDEMLLARNDSLWFFKKFLRK